MNAIALLPVEEAAQVLGCSVRTAEDLARSGTLPAVKFGDGGWRFPARALEEAVNEMAKEESKKRRRVEGAPLVAVTQPKRRSPPAIP